jgi:glycosyltransferase involved in cell wall biosynthesis
LSSEDAQRDFAGFSLSAANKARVLSFVAQPPADIYDSAPDWVCDQYHLPQRFIYLPNQFWKHKNHEIVIQALALVKAKHSEISVVCTGNPSDNRHPSYFAELLTSVSTLGLRDNFIILGMVPHAHLFQLMRQSLAVLQPSLFEGWSTTVEEAKSLGKRVILSDLPVHREQNPSTSIFFNPHDPQALAECLRLTFETAPCGPDDALESQAREQLPNRTRAFGRIFMEIVSEAVGLERRSDASTSYNAKR